MHQIKSMLCLLVGVSLALAGCFGAYQTRPDDPRGTAGLVPNVEDRDAGLVAVAPGFDLKAYRVIAVNQFSVTDAAIKDEGDRRLAQSMSVFLQSELVRRLRESGLFERVVNLTETPMPPAPPSALRIDGDIPRLGQGSQAVRAFFGLYGAGRTRAQVEMRFVEVTSGRVVLVTADRRIASMGIFGGDSKDHLRESFDDTARDLAKFLVRLSLGEAPRP
ncbi:MAG TPA: DUF4410 domain-containing protein [Methylomirabilota bacterium]|nr:DUF4410 domain-containing protein [Methylomirabilota bacterium]